MAGRKMWTSFVVLSIVYLKCVILPEYLSNLLCSFLKTPDIRKKSTSGTQTADSTFRAEQHTQVYLPKDATTATGVSTGSQTKREFRRINGLRGDKTAMKIQHFEFEM